MLPSNTQLEAEANTGALYQVTTSAGAADGPHTAPEDQTFHWSDGHHEITKKLSFSATDYELAMEASASLDGKPITPHRNRLAWWVWHDGAVYKSSATRERLLPNGRLKLSLPAIQKAGRFPRIRASTPNSLAPPEPLGIEDQFFTAAFIPDGGDVTLWHFTQYHTTSGGSE